jgi:hypothetical protein
VAQRQASWTRTQGTVASISRELQLDDDNHTVPYYAPVVRFRARNGDEVTFQDAVWTGGPRHAVGERVPVLYDPVDPQQATLAGWRPYFTTLVLAFATFVMAMIGVIGSLGPTG